MKQFLLFLLALVPLMASADVTKDGVFYRCYEGEGAYVASADKSLSGDIVIPEYVKDEDGTDYKVIVIDENAFQDRAITSIVLPSTLESIYEDAFQGCSSLKDVTCMALTPPRLNSDAFEKGHYSSVKIHVPTEALNSYKDDDRWKKFSTIDDKLGDDSGGIAINETNFPDPEFRAWLAEPSNLNGYGSDGKLTAEEIANITFMEILYHPIANLKGIEFFKELNTLYCRDLSLTSLDVSNLTKLVTLLCQDNQITSLNVSGCTELYELSCYNNNINETEMGKFVESLPTRTEPGRLIMVELGINEGNFMTKDQVTAANEKKWAVLALLDGKTYDYEGVISGIESVNGSVKSPGHWYMLGGQQLQGEPTQKGVYINNGKKFIKK